MKQKNDYVFNFGNFIISEVEKKITKNISLIAVKY